MKQLYNEYISTVSIEATAASYPVICSFLNEVNIRLARKIADLGSGISSAAIAHAINVEFIHSVDDKFEWLDKSKQFIVKHKLTNAKQEFILVDDWFNMDVKYDFIFYDMYETTTRIRNMDYVLTRLEKDGYIMFDDCHKKYLKNEIMRIKDKHNLKFIKETEWDRFGRRAELYVKE